MQAMHKRCCAIIVGAAFILDGCAPSGLNVPKTTQVTYYPQCYQPVQALRDADNEFEHALALNVALGAAGGAAIGALAGKDVKSAVLGMLGGAAVAAAGTYAAYQMQQQPNDSLRRSAIAGDLGHDSTEIHKAVIAARQADACYDRAFGTLTADVRKHSISNDVAAARFNEIQQGTREAEAILAAYGEKAQKSSAEYKVAFDQEAARLNTTPERLEAKYPVSSAPKTSKPRHKAEETEDASANGATEASTSAAGTKGSSAQQLSVNYQKYNSQVADIAQLDQDMKRSESVRENEMRGLGVATS